MYLNDVKLIGKVYDNSSVKPLANGDAVLTFTLVTTENFKNRDGESVIRKGMHRVIAFNKAAKDAVPDGVLFADTEVLVEGFLRSRESGGFLATEVIARRISPGRPPAAG